MRTNLIILLCLITLPVFANPDIKHWKSGNGARVYFVESHELPIVDIAILFDAGSARDPAGRNGLAVLTNNLLTHGADGMDAEAISFGFERLGAQVNTDTDSDSASITLRTLSHKQKLNAALEDLQRVISKPDFPVEALERQRNRILIGIQQKQQSPGTLARDAFFHSVYHDHPYAFPGEGTAETIQSVKREDIVEFYRQHYTAGNMVIAIVGDLDRRAAREIGRRLSASLGKGAVASPLPRVEPATRPGDQVRIHHPSEQMHILLGQTGIKRDDPDYFPLYVGNHILGGSGMVSRLYDAIREKRGLSYSVYSYFSPMRESGPFIAGLQTRGDQADTALALLRENIIKFIDEGPTTEELTSSKMNITGGFPLRIDSNSKILGYIAMIGFYGLPLDYLDRFNDRIEAVTVDQIKNAFRRRVIPEQWTTVMVGPLEKSAVESVN